jgi:hypothetical protein
VSNEEKYQEGLDQLQKEIQAAKQEMGLEKEEVKEETVQSETSSEAPVKNEVTEVVSEEKSQYSQEEQDAISQGWNPNYEGPDKRSAKEYLERGSFFKKIDAQNKEIKELKTLVKEVVDNGRKAQQAAYERALKQIEEQKLQALSSGDVDTYKQMEQHEVELKKQGLPQSMPQQQETPQELQEWADRNKAWFNTNPENEDLTLIAQGLENAIVYEYRRKGIEPNQIEVLEKVEKQIKQLPQYRARFDNPNQSKPSAVGTSTVTTSTKTSLTSQFSAQQKVIAENLARSGIMSKEEYARELKEQGSLGI